MNFWVRHRLLHSNTGDHWHKPCNRICQRRCPHIEHCPLDLCRIPRVCSTLPAEHISSRPLFALQMLHSAWPAQHCPFRHASFHHHRRIVEWTRRDQQIQGHPKSRSSWCFVGCRFAQKLKKSYSVFQFDNKITWRWHIFRIECFIGNLRWRHRLLNCRRDGAARKDDDEDGQHFEGCNHFCWAVRLEDINV